MRCASTKRVRRMTRKKGGDSSRRNSSNSRRNSSNSRRNSSDRPRGNVDWDNMGTGMMSDISHLSSNRSSSPLFEIDNMRLSDNQSFAVGSPLSSPRPLSSAGIERYIRENQSQLREEHKAGVRICYTGRMPAEGQQKEKKMGYYTIKQFLQIANDMLDDPSFMWLGNDIKPEYDDEYQTQLDLERLINILGANICSENVNSTSLMSCKVCEDNAKDGSMDSASKEARLDAEERREVRAVRRENRRLLRNEVRRGVPGARETQAARRRSRRMREERRAARRATRRSQR